jgi:hypothetical protein
MHGSSKSGLDARMLIHHACVAVFLLMLSVLTPLQGTAQAVKGKVTKDDPPPPLTYRGLVPGLSSAEQVRNTLGEPIYEAKWYAYKLLYPAEGRSGLVDSLHLSGRGGYFAGMEAASVPIGYGGRAAILEKLGEPEFELRMPTFTLLDYSAGGLRFILNSDEETIGISYFPHLRPRVHGGARKFIDLSSLREGPQPRPAKPASTQGLMAGVSEVKITPKREWLNPRYQSQFQAHDDIWARCLVLEKDGLTLALVGADLFGMSATDIQPMRDRVASDGVEHMVLAMSHNHAAPDTIGVYGHFPAEYIEFLQNEIVRCVLEARAQLEPVKELRTASRELPMDGARVIGYIRNARNPGIVDPTISTVQPIGASGRAIATLVNFACHVEGLEKGVVELSADFPGYMCEQIRRDGGGQAVFLNGALGGMISGDTRARTHEEAKKAGLGFAAFVSELTEIAQPAEQFDFNVETRRVEIPLTNERFEPLFEGRRPLHRGRVVTDMSLITLGECQMITIPGELLPEISFEIQEQMKGFPRMLIGLANDELGYIVPAYDFRDDAYEESMSVGPATGPIIRDTAIRLLSGVR